MKRKTLRTWLLALVGLAVLAGLGYLIAWLLIPVPQIAVVRIDGDIWGSYTALLREAFDDVAGDRAVRAVVLVISSPGGEVTASEGLYLDILNLRSRLPVVASVDEMAASGAYYAACAADEIYAKPASMVGNIGVVSFLPEPDLVDEWLVTTGPFKLSGGTQVEYLRQMEILKNTFLASILAQRADRLQVGPEVLSRGELYIGLQAEQMGLIDRVGSQTDAVEAAAELARLRHYEVVDRTPEISEETLLLLGRLPVTAVTSATLATPPRDLPPGLYYRYVEPPQ